MGIGVGSWRHRPVTVLSCLLILAERQNAFAIPASQPTNPLHATTHLRADARSEARRAGRLRGRHRRGGRADSLRAAGIDERSVGATHSPPRRRSLCPPRRSVSCRSRRDEKSPHSCMLCLPIYPVRLSAFLLFKLLCPRTLRRGVIYSAILQGTPFPQCFALHAPWACLFFSIASLLAGSLLGTRIFISGT